MTFNEYIDSIFLEHKHNPNVQEFMQYVKYRWKYPFTSEEEAQFIIAANDPLYSRNGIKKLYKEIFAYRRERMIKFFSMTEEELLPYLENVNEQTL